MIKKTIEYTDYNGEKRKEDFYFNLSKAELLEMQLSATGGLEEFLEKIIQTQDGPALVKMFKDIILKAYGEKSPDGRTFMKNDEIRARFECSEAYSELFMELATNSDAAADFINHLLPADLAASAAERDEIVKKLQG